MSDTDPQPAAAPEDAESVLRRLIDVVANAKSMLMSSSAIVNRDEVLELLDDAIERMPVELREARWMLKERTEFLAKVQREADDILDAAKVRASRLVEKQEIVREAQSRAMHTVESAREEATRLRLEAEDYCDQKLASFEIVLDRLLKTSQAGRKKLAGQSILTGDISMNTDLGTSVQGRSSLDLTQADEFFDQEA